MARRGRLQALPGIGLLKYAVVAIMEHALFSERISLMRAARFRLRLRVLIFRQLFFDSVSARRRCKKATIRRTSVSLLHHLELASRSVRASIKEGY